MWAAVCDNLGSIVEPVSRRAEVLLVDEQREGLARLEACFAPLGHELVLAHSSEEALRELLRRELALVVVAGSSGPDAARRIRQHARGRGVSMLVVGTSAHPGPAIPRTPDAAPLEMLEAGVDIDLLRSRAALLVELQVKTRRIKTLERTARQRAREARQAMIVRDQFLSVASHELRTPLTSLKLEIANLTRMVRRNDSQDSAHLVPRVERIEAQASRLHRLIDELLDASRIAAGRLELVLEEVDLSAVAEDVVARFDHEAARLGSTLAVRAPVPAVGYWDRSRVDQVLSNLVSNAIKYGDGKPIEVAVEVTPEARPAPSARQRRGNRGAGPGPHLRTVRTGRLLAQLWRGWPRVMERAQDRRRARRDGERRFPAGARGDVYRLAAVGTADGAGGDSVRR